MKHQIVDEIFGGTAHGGKHVGDFFSEGGELLLLAALGGQGGQMALKDDAGLKHLPGLKAVQRADEARAKRFRIAAARRRQKCRHRGGSS